jgi:hypothetical protein
MGVFKAVRDIKEKAEIDDIHTCGQLAVVEAEQCQAAAGS